MAASVQTGMYNGIPVLYLADEIDLSAHPRLKSTLEQFARENSRMLIDMSDVTYMDSSPLGLLINLDAEVSQRGGVLAISSLPPLVRRIFEVSGLVHYLNVFDNADEATKYLNWICGRGTAN